MPSIAVVFVVSLCLISSAPGAEDNTFDLFFIDVDGGAATLIMTPERESILIDSGWAGKEDRDPKRIEHVLKEVAGLDHLDHLVTTHWHMDHFGGVAGLVKRVRVDHFWDRGLPDLSKPNADRAEFPDGPGASDALGVAYRAASEGKRKTLRAGDKIPLRGGVEALVLASGSQVIAVPDAPRNPACADAPADLAPDPSDNARSLTIRFRFKGFTFLDCGDLTWNVEKQLVCPADKIGHVDLFQVTHHGMAISNHPTLVRTIAPTVAVMNNGPRKGGDPKAVALFKSLPSIQALYQLHKNATTSAGDNTDASLIANSSAEGGKFVRATVAADGATFQVRIGADGAPRSFRTR